MSVRREVQVAVGSEDGEHLVALRIDGFTHVLHTTQSTLGDGDAPDVQSTHTAWHIADEVEPVAIGRNSRMGITGQCVF